MLIDQIIKSKKIASWAPLVLVVSLFVLSITFSIINENTNRIGSNQVETGEIGTATHINPTYEFIIQTYKQLDRIERQNFKHKIVGEKVVWIGKVEKINKGKIVIRVGKEKYNIAQFFIYPIPDIHVGENVEIKANIKNLSSFLGRITFDLTDPIISVLPFGQNELSNNVMEPDEEALRLTERVLPTKTNLVANIITSPTLRPSQSMNVEPTPTATSTVFWIVNSTFTATITPTKRHPATNTLTPTPSITLITTFSPTVTTLAPTEVIFTETSAPTGTLEPTITRTPVPTKTPRKPIPSEITSETVIPSTPTDIRSENNLLFGWYEIIRLIKVVLSK